MGRRTISFRDLLGLIKDKASLSKASLLSNNATLHLAVLRSTTHAPPSPPDDRRISALMELGDGSRATASTIVSALMDRLQNTRNSVVALKCLVIIHNIIKRGPFILQDQLSVFPRNGGYNYLNLSGFRDGSTPATWALSAWVRWYAGYLEALLTGSRVLGYFLCSSSSSVVRESQEQKISSFLNVDLIRDVDSLVVLVEETCKVPDGSNVSEGDDVLVKEIMGLLTNDHLSIVNEILLRLGELNQRLTVFTFGDSVELICALKRFQDCREILLTVMHMVKKPSVEMMWGMVEELRGKIGMSEVYREGGRKLLCLRDKASESDRFGQRVPMRVGRDPVRFQSSRFDMSKVF